MRSAAAFVLLVLSTSASFAQQPAPPPAGPLRVFLDCGHACDFDFLRTEIGYVDHVRDRKDADVHVLVTTQTNATRGEDFQLQYIGLGRFDGQAATLRYPSGGTATADERRRGFARTFALGLVPFLYDTPAFAQLAVRFDPSAAPAPTAASAVNDPWNLWVFRLGLRTELEGESAQTERGIEGEVSASRTTDTWRLSSYNRIDYNEDEFTLSDGRRLENVRRTWFSRALAVRSLGSEHWAAAVRLQTGASTFENRDFALRGAAGLEYSVFPYAESTRRALFAQYLIGVNYLDYAEVTIFDKQKETVYDQTFRTTLALRQPWGFSRMSVEAASYLHDPSLHRMQVDGRLDVRLFRGLSLNIDGSASRVRDQLYLPKGGATDEEILLRLRQLQTGHRYRLSAGVNYQFGSIFNNVVNPRFDGL